MLLCEWNLRNLAIQPKTFNLYIDLELLSVGICAFIISEENEEQDSHYSKVMENQSSISSDMTDGTTCNFDFTTKVKKSATMLK